MLTPIALIEIGETEDVGFNFFNSLPVDLQLKIVVEPEETHITIAAENRRYCRIAATLETLLKASVSWRWKGRADSVSGVAVEMAKQSVAKSFQLAKQGVCGFELAFDANGSPNNMLKSALLIESQDSINFRSCDKEELFSDICGQLAKALPQK
jgi:hypothetical protein